MRLHFATQRASRPLDPVLQSALVEAYSASFGSTTRVALAGPPPTAPRLACLFVSNGAVLVVDVHHVELFLLEGGSVTAFRQVCATIVDSFGSGTTARCLGRRYVVSASAEIEKLCMSWLESPGKRCTYCHDEIAWDLIDENGDEACARWKGWTSVDLDHDPRPPPCLDAPKVDEMVKEGLTVRDLAPDDDDPLP
jgi:hypothetical protein